MLRTILNSRMFLWALLSLPALAMLIGYGRGQVSALELLHPTGEFSARLMIVAMMLSPLVALLGPKPWLNWFVKRRRYFGVAAFGYALLHLAFYVIDMESVANMLAEIGALGIWTGWFAMLLFVPLALTSNNAAMR
ncbi:MAG: ferric reductase-like transmembrane domain-containing protein, partial [Pseudomonadota bacterium]